MTPIARAFGQLVGLRPKPAAFEEKDIEFAFTSAGTDYYCFKGSGYSLYYERYVGAQDAIWACEHYRMSQTDLIGFLTLLKTHYNNGDLVEASVLTDNMLAIVQYCGSLPMLYNLAAVWYFDKTESPYSFDKEYAEEKIDRWMQDKETLAFFLKTPVAGYIPSPDTTEENFRNFMRLSTETQLKIYERRLSKLSAIERESDTIKSLFKSMARLKASLNLAG